MTLGELLDELRENILHDRSDRVAGEVDQLWSDATLVRYIDEAQRRFARKALVIRDGAHPDVTRVTLATGVTEYTLHQAVMAVMSVKVTGDSGDLARAGHAAFDAYRQPDTLYFDPSALAVMPAGRPLAFSTDERVTDDDEGTQQAIVLRVYPEPSVAYNGVVLRLRVVRLPIERLSADNLQSIPELPEAHHLEMLDWAAHLALRIVDVDAGMPSRSREFRASFEDHVKAARDALMRKVFAPMQWGFGRSGFSWEK